MDPLLSMISLIYPLLLGSHIDGLVEILTKPHGHIVLKGSKNLFGCIVGKLAHGIVLHKVELGDAHISIVVKVNNSTKIVGHNVLDLASLSTSQLALDIVKEVFTEKLAGFKVMAVEKVVLAENNKPRKLIRVSLKVMVPLDQHLFPLPCSLVKIKYRHR